MSAITPERAQEIRARLEAATPGPWGARAVASEGEPIRPVFTAEGDLVIEYEPTWEPDADLIHNAPTDLPDLLDERDRMGHELAWWAARFPCDGMCSPNDGPQEDCSRHGRAPKDLWGIITRLTAENNAMRAVVEAYERWTGDPDGWAEMAVAVRAYRATTGEAGQ